MFIASGALYARQTGILTKKNRRRSVWLTIGIDRELRNQAALAKNTRFKRKRSFIHPRFQGAKAQLRLRRTRALKTNLRFFRLLIPPQRSEGGMGVQRDVGVDWSLPRPVGNTGRRNVGNRKERWNIATMRVPRNIRISPSSFWAQRSAQPVGIHTKILSK